MMFGVFWMSHEKGGIWFVEGWSAFDSFVGTGQQWTVGPFDLMSSLPDGWHSSLIQWLCSLFEVQSSRFHVVGNCCNECCDGLGRFCSCLQVLSHALQVVGPVHSSLFHTQSCSGCVAQMGWSFVLPDNLCCCQAWLLLLQER